MDQSAVYHALLAGFKTLLANVKTAPLAPSKKRPVGLAVFPVLWGVLPLWPPRCSASRAALVVMLLQMALCRVLPAPTERTGLGRSCLNAPHVPMAQVLLTKAQCNASLVAPVASK
jgi:hypothetical protein